MKSYISYIFAFAICFAVIDLSFALGKVQEECLRKNGLNNSTDVELVKAFLRSNGKNEFHLEKEFSCFFACMIDKERNENDVTISTYQLLTDIIERTTYQVLAEQLKRDLMSTLENCHQQDEGDDCKLFYCLKILRAPFRDLLISVD